MQGSAASLALKRQWNVAVTSFCPAVSRGAGCPRLRHQAPCCSFGRVNTWAGLGRPDKDPELGGTAGRLRDGVKRPHTPARRSQAQPQSRGHRWPQSRSTCWGLALRPPVQASVALGPGQLHLRQRLQHWPLLLMSQTQSRSGEATSPSSSWAAGGSPVSPDSLQRACLSPLSVHTPHSHFRDALRQWGRGLGCPRAGIVAEG